MYANDQTEGDKNARYFPLRIGAVVDVGHGTLEKGNSPPIRSSYNDEHKLPNSESFLHKTGGSSTETSFANGWKK